MRKPNMLGQQGKFALLAQKFKGNMFLRNIIILMSGTAGAQLLGLALMPLLTRLFSTSEFGIAASFQAMLAVICIVSNLRYELAIPLTKTDEDAQNLFVFNILLLFIFSLAVSIVLHLWGSDIATFFKLQVLLPYLWFMPIAIFILGLYQIFSYWAIRHKIYKALAQTKITQVFAMLLFQIIAYKQGTFALIMGQAIGQGGGGFRLGLHAFRHIEKAKLSFQRMKALVKEYKRFPLYDTPAALLNNASAQLPFLLLIGVFSPVLTGAYALSYRVLSLPTSLVAQSVASAFYGDVRELAASGRLAIMNQRLAQKLALLAIVPSIIVVWFAPTCFAFIFGENWYQAGEIASYSIVWVFLQFIYSPLSGSLLALNKQNLNLAVQVILFSLRLGALVIGITYFDEMTTIFLFSVASMVAYLCGLIILSYASGSSLGKMLLFPMAGAMALVICTSYIYFGAA